MLQHSGRLADRVQRLLPVRLPVSAEQAALPFSIPGGVVVDDSATRQELAIERRELRETLADTVRWLAARGLVTAAPGRCPGRLTRPRSGRHRRAATAAGLVRRTPSAAAPLPTFSNAELSDFPVSCRAWTIGGHRRNL